MKKFIIVLFSVFISFYSYPQNDNLKNIIDGLNNFQNYQSTCDYTFSMPFGDPMRFEATITVQKAPADTLCGFYYDFETNENYRGDSFGDFSLYFNYSAYSSYQGKVKKNNRFNSPQLYYITPYVLSSTLNNALLSNATVIQIPDTIINQYVCSQFIIESYTNSTFNKENINIHEITELCFHKSDFYPVYYKKNIKSSFINSFQIAYFRDTKVNASLPKNYFSEENLLPHNLKNPTKNEEKERINSGNLVGEKAPDWILPVLGKDEMMTNKSVLGKYVLMEFTATWCVHCIKAAEMMNRLEERFKNSKKIAILSIFSSDIDKEEFVQKFAEKFNLKSTILHSASKVSKDYQVNSYPNFLIISPKGKVITNFPGYNETVEKNIINTLSEFVE